jgi:hypothetical protein
LVRGRRSTPAVPGEAGLSYAAARRTFVYDAIAIVVCAIAQFDRVRMHSVAAVVAVISATNARWVTIVITVERVGTADASDRIAALTESARVGIQAVGIARAHATALTAHAGIAQLACHAPGRHGDVRTARHVAEIIRAGDPVGAADCQW